MVCTLAVQALEMSAVVREDGPPEAMSAGQNVRIGGRLPAVFLCGNHVMTKPTEFLHHREREVFVGVKLHSPSLHKSFFTLFVFSDGLIDFLPVGSGITPRRFQVSRR
jgi:hypothetical protein